jgi:hypothetical protein
MEIEIKLTKNKITTRRNLKKKSDPVKKTIKHHEGIKAIKSAYFGRAITGINGIDYSATENNGHGLRILVPLQNIETSGYYSYFPPKETDFIKKIDTEQGQISVYSVKIIKGYST